MNPRLLLSACIMFVVTFFAGCLTPASKLTQLSVGMTRTQVVEILGPPVSVSARADGGELLRYELRGIHAADGWPPRKPTAGYTVQLHHGKVTAYGRDDEFRRLEVQAK